MAFFYLRCMVINLSEHHSLVSNWISELRSTEIQTDRMRFRRNIERIGEIAAYEISRHLPWHEVETQTPLGIHNSQLLTEQPVLATILRAGLPLHPYRIHEQPDIGKQDHNSERPNACHRRFPRKDD